MKLVIDDLKNEILLLLISFPIIKPFARYFLLHLNLVGLEVPPLSYVVNVLNFL